jgi:hypothetical protein
MQPSLLYGLQGGPAGATSSSTAVSTEPTESTSATVSLSASFALESGLEELLVESPQPHRREVHSASVSRKGLSLERVMSSP